MAPEKSVNGGKTVSPVVKANASPTRTAADTKTDNDVKKEESTNSNAARPLAPPPRPSEVAQGGDYFSQTHEHPPPPSHLLYEPNPFDASFSGQTTSAGGEVATPGGTKLPSVAALTSPASLLPGGGGMTPFWGNSLRSGPLSPAMLAGPQGDYFTDGHQFRGPFGSGVTPNESSLRTGLTPGGGGSMFPPTPTTAALFNIANGGATPGTLDFHRTAVNAAAIQKQNNSSQQHNVTSQPQSNGVSNGNVERLSHQHPDPFGQGDANDAANGLFLLAQSQNSQRDGQPNNGYVVAPPQPVHSQQALENSPQMRTRNHNGSVGGASQRGASIGSNGHSDESEQQQNRPNTRGRGKRGAAAQTNGRRKAEETPTKAPASKKSKANNGNSMSHMEPEPQSDEEQDPDMNKDEYNANGKKMTDEEKRKNFLERNRVAALKCRQRKKQWLANLQHKVEAFANENEGLQTQIIGMRDEIVQLKTVLMAHKDCSMSQQQPGFNMEHFLGAMPPGGYSDGPTMAQEQGMYPLPIQAQQPHMNGEIDHRRYS